jgi:hypothetical protein
MPVPANYRWLFEDPVAVTSYRVPINPNRMTTPYLTKRLETAPTIRGHWRIRRSGHLTPYEWTFSGVIRDMDHHDALLEWSRKPNSFTITDHLGRTFEVVPVSFKPVEKRPSATVPDKFDYDFTVLVLGVS